MVMVGQGTGAWVVRVAMVVYVDVATVVYVDVVKGQIMMGGLVTIGIGSGSERAGMMLCVGWSAGLRDEVRRVGMGSYGERRGKMQHWRGKLDQLKELQSWWQGHKDQEMDSSRARK